MSKFSKNKVPENRFETFVLKLKVMLGLFLFKKIEIEKDEIEFNYYMEKDLKEWCNSKGITISIVSIERPMYITGHGVYELDTKKQCKRLSFSK